MSGKLLYLYKKDIFEIGGKLFVELSTKEGAFVERSGGIFHARDYSGTLYTLKAQHYSDKAIRAEIINMQEGARKSKNIKLILALCEEGTLINILELATDLGIRGVLLFNPAYRAESALYPEGAQKLIKGSYDNENETLVKLCPSFDDALDICSESELKLFPNEREDGRHVSALLYGQEQHSSASLIIGAEKGLSAEEEGTAIEGGYSSVSLSANILRVSTAAALALSCVYVSVKDG